MNATEGKIEITTKFSQIPEYESDEKAKTVSFKVFNGKFYICATLTDKMWGRFTENASKFESWVCAIVGKIKNISNNDIYIEEPALQVFENQKKPKPEQNKNQKQNQPHHKKHQNDINPNNLNNINNKEKKSLEIKQI